MLDRERFTAIQVETENAIHVGVERDRNDHSLVSATTAAAHMSNQRMVSRWTELLISTITIHLELPVLSAGNVQRILP